jgi:hypothetical protein
MWNSPVTETQQPEPPGEAMAEEQSDSLVDGTAPAADSEKTRTPTAPGSEYWLP